MSMLGALEAERMNVVLHVVIVSILILLVKKS